MSTAAASARRCASACSSVTWLSWRPSDQAKPELADASALKPSCASSRALPTSHGFGMTKQPDWCSSRKTRRLPEASLLGGKRGVERGLEVRVRPGAAHEPHGLHLAVRRADADQERRRAVQAQALRLREVLADARGLLAGVEACLERARVEPERLGVADELFRLQRALVGEQRVVHLPVLALVTGAERGLVGLERLRVDR